MGFQDLRLRLSISRPNRGLGKPLADILCPGLGFASPRQARRYARPNRVRQPTDCMFASSCFPPRLTATQLPSATRIGHLLKEDFHLFSRACSQAHRGFRFSEHTDFTPYQSA
jgi:hypothetical protein